MRFATASLIDLGHFHAERAARNNPGTGSQVLAPVFLILTKLH